MEMSRRETLKRIDEGDEGDDNFKLNKEDKVNFYDLENMILNRKLSLLARTRPTFR